MQWNIIFCLKFVPSICFLSGISPRSIGFFDKIAQKLWYWYRKTVCYQYVLFFGTQPILSFEPYAPLLSKRKEKGKIAEREERPSALTVALHVRQAVMCCECVWLVIASWLGCYFCSACEDEGRGGEEQRRLSTYSKDKSWFPSSLPHSEKALVPHCLHILLTHTALIKVCVYL